MSFKTKHFITAAATHWGETNPSVKPNPLQIFKESKKNVSVQVFLILCHFVSVHDEETDKNWTYCSCNSVNIDECEQRLWRQTGTWTFFIVRKSWCSFTDGVHDDRPSSWWSLTGSEWRPLITWRRRNRKSDLQFHSATRQTEIFYNFDIFLMILYKNFCSF